MRKPSKLAILFNGAAILIGTASVIAVLRSILSPEEMAPCTTRYEHGTELSLERSPAELLTPADLQARLDGSDWGLLERASIVRAKDVASRGAIEVRFEPTGNQPARHNGMGFTWSPRLLGRPSAACLAYSVRLEDGFDFGSGGRLPGLMGAAEPVTGDKSVFSARYVWRNNGGVEIYGHMPDWPESRWLPNNKGGFTLPKGRWVALEQEVVLNSPGQKNGVLRVWADGALKFESTGLAFRKDPEVGVSGVHVEAVHGLGDSPGPARQQRLWLSPLELRW